MPAYYERQSFGPAIQLNTASLSITIAGVPVTFVEDTLKIMPKLDERWHCQFTVLDYTGTQFFQYGEQVVVTDTTLGVLYSGYIATVKQDKTKSFPNVLIEHQIDCLDKRHLADKRTSARNYTNQYAGVIAADQIQRYLSAENVSGAFGLHWDELQTDWQQGTLSGTAATTNASDGSPGAGDVELAPAGSTVTFGPYSAATNALANNAIKMTAYLQAGYQSAVVYRQIWGGTQAVASGDSLNYDVWISSTSPGVTAGIDVLFQDGTLFSSYQGVAPNSNGAGFDGEGIGPNPANDLSGFANDTWYTRSMGVQSPVTTKTIKAIYACIAGGSSAGTYTVYFRRVSWANGATTKISVFTDTTTQLQTNAYGQDTGFINTALSIVPTTDKIYSIISGGSIASAGIVKSSVITWQTTQMGQSTKVTSGVTINASIDGGLTYLPCTSGSALPVLTPGMNASGVSITLQLLFTQSTQPDSMTALSSISYVVGSSYACTKTDVLQTYSSSNFGSGTNSNTVTSGSNLTINGQLRAYASTGDYNGQTTLFGASGSVFLYRNALALTNASTAATFVRLDGVGNTWQNFTAEVDVYVSSTAGDSNGLVYRTTNFGSGAAAFSYRAMLSTGSVVLQKGTNTTGGTSITTLSTVTLSLTGGSSHRLKVVTSGTSHQVYVDEVLLISVTDATFNITGYFGLCYNNSTGASVIVYYAHFGVTSQLTGTWTSGSLSLTSAGTYGNSFISWDTSQTPDTTSIAVNVSTNGGSTWTACTNGAALPGFTAGQSLSSVNAQFQVILTSNNASAFPSLDGLTVIVMGSYSASGTRTTAPLGIDTMGRANQSGFGISFDGQTWTQTGTGTTAISSNEATISNTTGDVHEVLGSNTGTDMDATVRFQLSAASMQAGIELRYFNSSNLYRLAVGTSSLSIVKVVGGTATTLSSASLSLLIGTYYRLRFRVVGSGPASLWGKVWLDGNVEPGIATPQTPQWTVTATN